MLTFRLKYFIHLAIWKMSDGFKIPTIHTFQQSMYLWLRMFKTSLKLLNPLYDMAILYWYLEMVIRIGLNQIHLETFGVENEYLILNLSQIFINFWTFGNQQLELKKAKPNIWFVLNWNHFYSQTFGIQQSKLKQVPGTWYQQECGRFRKKWKFGTLLSLRWNG